MLAVSFISTIKVLWPRPRSSLAPTRVKMRSSRPTTARLAGTKQPQWARRREHRDLADVGALARHVRAGENDEAFGFEIEPHVVGNKFFVGRELLEHRMPRFLKQEQTAVVHLGLEIIAFLRERAPAEQDVDFMQRARGVLDRPQMRYGGGAEIEKKFVLELPRAFLCAEDFRFHLLQLGRHEALGIRQRLLARVVGGNGLQVRRADLDVVTEDLVVADLKRFDAGPFLLAALEIGEPFLAFDRSGAKFLERRVVAGADEAAFLQQNGRIVRERARIKIGQLGQGRNLAAKLTQGSDVMLLEGTP